MAKLEPGVYFYETSMNGNVIEPSPLLAKSTDGWVYYIPDVESFAYADWGEYAVPYNFTAFEPTNKYHNIFQSNGGSVFDSEINHYYRDDIYEFQTRSDMLNGTSTAMIQASLKLGYPYTTTWTKVADSQGDNKGTYKYIREHYFRSEGETPVPCLDDMLKAFNTVNAPKWRNDIYPKSLEEMKIVFPLEMTTQGADMNQSVYRDWGCPSEIDKVCEIDVTAHCSFEDGSKYIETVKREGQFTEITQDSPSENFWTFEATRENVQIENKKYTIETKISAFSTMLKASFKIVYIKYV